jgi:hypothetical protein
MTTVSFEPTHDITQSLGKVLSSARYLINAQGHQTDVVLSLAAFQNLLALLEDLDDRRIIQEWLPKLTTGPVATGALRWSQVAEEWEDHATI